MTNGDLAGHFGTVSDFLGSDIGRAEARPSRVRSIERQFHEFEWERQCG